jgi:hypothetical protein
VKKRNKSMRYLKGLVCFVFLTLICSNAMPLSAEEASAHLTCCNRTCHELCVEILCRLIDIWLCNSLSICSSFIGVRLRR